MAIAEEFPGMGELETEELELQSMAYIVVIIDDKNALLDCHVKEK